MADAVGGENFENDGEENGPTVGREQETREVVDGREEMRDGDTGMGNSGERNKDKKGNKRGVAWKIIYQNIRGLVTNSSREKVSIFYEEGRLDKILLMNFTETWLNSETEICPEMGGYRLYRGVRSHRGGGGVAIYVKSEFEAQKIAEMSTDEVEMVAVYIEKLNIINIVIYRPPGTKGKNFSEVLGKVKEILRKVKTPEPTVVITGDFNFAFVEWTRGKLGGYEWKRKMDAGATKNEQRQFESLNEQMDEFEFIQIIEEPAWEENTLDLIYTNKTLMIIQVENNVKLIRP